MNSQNTTDVTSYAYASPGRAWRAACCVTCLQASLADLNTRLPSPLPMNRCVPASKQAYMYTKGFSLRLLLGSFILSLTGILDIYDIQCTLAWSVA